MQIINGNAIFEQIIYDLENHKNISNHNAVKWAEKHDESIVSAMWDAYSKYIEENKPYQNKEDKND